MALGLETGVYKVDLSLVLSIVLSKDMEKLESAEMSVNSA